MNPLVVIQNQQVLTTSLQVAESFEKLHKDVLESIDTLIKGVAENPAYSKSPIFHEGTYDHPQNKQQYRMFYMNRDGFTLLAMGFTGSKAIQFKLQYIQAFNNMEQQLVEVNKPSYEISDPVTRARKWIEEEQHRQQLQLTIQQQQPKVLFADSVTASDTTILIRELSKTLKQNGIDIGEKRLFAWLREKGYLIKRFGSDYNLPTQRAMDLGLFFITQTTINRSSGAQIARTARVTGKGQQYFINKFLKGAISS